MVLPEPAPARPTAAPPPAAPPTPPATVTARMLGEAVALRATPPSEVTVELVMSAVTVLGVPALPILFVAAETPTASASAGVPERLTEIAKDPAPALTVEVSEAVTDTLELFVVVTLLRSISAVVVLVTVLPTPEPATVT